MQLGHAAIDYGRACSLLNLLATATGPGERMVQIPGWLQTELVATPEAESKLRLWSESTPPPWTNSDAGTILPNLYFYGDVEIAAHTADVLSQLPTPVAAYVRRATTFTGAGLSLHGHCGSRPDFGSRPWWIELSATNGVERLRDVVAHEVAHAWLLPEPAPGQTTATAFAWSTIVHLPIPDDLDLSPETLECVAQRRALSARRETEARALTRAWGFSDV
jgi:hypothetical protein